MCFIDLTINFNPVAADDIFALLRIEIEPSVDKQEFCNFLVKEFSPNIFYIWTFSNLPNIFVCWSWFENMKQLNRITKQIKHLSIKKMTSDILMAGLYYKTWIDETLQTN